MVGGGVGYGRGGLEVEGMVGEGRVWNGRGGYGRECYLSTNLISFCFSTHARAHAPTHTPMSVSQLNKLANSFGPSVPGRDNNGAKRPRNKNVIYVTSQYCAIGTGQSKS